MASARQIAANRRNAQKSCGPKTEAGKQRSSMNALRHGMTARVIVLPHEDSIAYHEIRAGLLESYAPVNAHETMLVDQIAAGYWRTLRARRFETAMFAAGAATYKENHGKSVEPNAGHDDQVCAVWMTEIPEEKLKNYYRYDASIERQYYRAMAALEKAQAARFRHEERIERILRNADPDTIAVPSPEPPPPTPVSENGTGFVSSQQDEGWQAATAALENAHPIEDIATPEGHDQLADSCGQPAAGSPPVNESARKLSAPCCLAFYPNPGKLTGIAQIGSFR